MPARFTVIIPMYNCAPYIEQCLASLTSQTFSDFEAICVDDRSTDGTAELARKASGGDPRFHFLATAKNSGQSVARNVALDSAHGDIVVLLDADDYLTADALQLIDERFSTQRLDDLYFNGHSFYEDYGAYRNVVENFEGRESFEGVASGLDLFAWFQQRDQWFPHGALRAVKRELIEDNGIRFCEGIIHEDLLFTIQTMLASHRSSFLNKQIYQRRIHTGSTMAQPRKTMANITGHLVSIHYLQDFLATHRESLTRCQMDALAQQISYYLYHCAKDYLLDVDDTAKRTYLASLPDEEYARFQLEIAQPAHALDELFSSRAYRAGQCVVAAPKFIRDSLRAHSNRR